MRRLLALPQGGPLPHAELMLFVDDHQPQAGKSHVLLQKRVGADHHVDLPRGDVCQGRFALFLRQAAHEQHVPHTARLEQAGERIGMLAGKNFRGCHQGRLVTAGHTSEHGVHGYYGLAAADVALQQPIHRRFAGHVAGHFTNRGPLTGGEFERKKSFDSRIDIRCGYKRGRAKSHLLLPAPCDHRQLQNEKFLKYKSPPRSFQLARVLRRVDRRQGRGERHEVEFSKQLRRKYFL
jgi:hypothetical protein